MSQIWMKRLSHVWMSYVTHMNEEVYHTYASVMSHVRMKKCVTHMQESCSETSSNDHMNEEVYQVMSHIWMKRYITHMQESYSESSSSGAYFGNQSHETYAYTHINESFYAYSWVVWRNEWVMQQVVFQWRLFWKSIQWVIWHTRTRHVTHMNDLCDISIRNHYLA